MKKGNDEYKKGLAKVKKERDKENKKTLAMGLDDFKKVVVSNIDELQDAMLETFNWNADQHDVFIHGITKAIRNINNDLDKAEKNFKVLDERLRALAEFTTIFAITAKERFQRKPMTFKERKAFAGMASIKWDTTNDKTYNVTMHRAH